MAQIDRRIFGSFAEHMGRCIYGGIFEPGDVASDQRGFRTDVIELVKELGVTIVRYPGGNFVSGYDWKDGVGAPASRPRRLDPAWRSVETNEFGLDEFMNWCELAGVEPMLATNLGTGTLRDALELLEYSNAPVGSKFADLRAANGSTAPYGVTVWCLGNEMDGPWQVGHMNAREYARAAASVARGMRMIDPTVELVACGSSSRTMRTFGTWEDAVLQETYDVVDYISAHAYYENLGDLQSFLVSSTDMDRFISEVCAVADSVKARRRSDKTLYISFDEWNVWYLSRLESRLSSLAWQTAPRLSEDDYTVADAVVVGNLLVSLLRRCDRVKMACLAQLVNTIGTIRAEPGGIAWRQPTFYPFSLTARHARGTTLVTQVTSPLLTTDKYGAVNALDAIATVDDEAAEASLFLVNRSVAESLTTSLQLRGFGGFEVIEHVVLSDENPLKTNSVDEPTAVAPVRCGGWLTSGSTVQVQLPAASWSMLRLQLRNAADRPRELPTRVAALGRPHAESSSSSEWSECAVFQLEEQREQAYRRMRREVTQVATGPVDRLALTDAERAVVADWERLDAAVRAARGARFAPRAQPASE